MKINKRKPSHWLYLALFTITAALAALLRATRVVKAGHHCTLYGHKLNGNLKALYEHNFGNSASSMQMRFLCMDPQYCKELRQIGVSVINGINPCNARALATSFAIVSDHGLHSLRLLLRFTDIPFFDVWHGIPLKGFDQDNTRVRRQYEKSFVTSKAVARVYEEKFGFRRKQLEISGYARTDILVDRPSSVEHMQRELGINDLTKKVVLFAPTWQQDDADRNILPFGKSGSEFLQALEAVCLKTDALCIFRTHLNSEDTDLTDYPHILPRPHSIYPNTEEILLVSDCLISDWSSIVFDFMLLDRPTIFLDVPHPFKKGFSLGPENRFGKLVGSLDGLSEALEIYLLDPAAYAIEFGAKHASVKALMYDGNADGHAAQRVCNNLDKYRPAD